MEEILKQILDGQKGIINRLDDIDKRLDNLEKGQTSITKRLDGIDRRLDNLEKNNIEAHNALLEIIQKTYKKAEQIDNIADDINFLLQRNAKHAQILRKAYVKIPLTRHLLLL
jgi:septal ring factor EnvC (AmiA/AmiB activator)